MVRYKNGVNIDLNRGKFSKSSQRCYIKQVCQSTIFSYNELWNKYCLLLLDFIFVNFIVRAPPSLYPLYSFFGSEDHVALDRNPGPAHDTLLLRLIPGYLLNACTNRQIHTLPSLLDSRAALPNSNPNKCVPSRKAVCTIL